MRYTPLSRCVNKAPVGSEPAPPFLRSSVSRSSRAKVIAAPVFSGGFRHAHTRRPCRVMAGRRKRLALAAHVVLRLLITTRFGSSIARLGRECGPILSSDVVYTPKVGSTGILFTQLLLRTG